MVVLSCPLDSNGIPSGELSVQKWQVETLANDTLQEEPVKSGFPAAAFTLKLRLFSTIRNTIPTERMYSLGTESNFKIRC